MPPSIASVSPVVDPHQFQALRTTLEDCRRACGQGADAWLAHSPLGSDALRCIRMMLDCADLCAAAEELLPHCDEANPVVLRSHLSTCAVASERCARELQLYRRLPLTRCIALCRETASLCRAAIPHLPAVAAAAA